MKTTSIKKIIILFSSIFMIIEYSSCTVRVKTNGSDTIPPGQIKKITGSKSAEPYAPGHNK